jgi:hypothetical protein
VAGKGEKKGRLEVLTLEITGAYAILKLSVHELVIVNNALNEVCNGIEFSEFSTRMGAEHREVLEFLSHINALLGIVEKKEGTFQNGG